MKQVFEKQTLDLFGKLSRARSPNPSIKPLAQRQREYRQRQKFNFLNSVTRNEK